MNNLEIYNELTKESKSYIDTFYSLLDYFREERVKITITDHSTRSAQKKQIALSEGGNEIFLASLLSILYEDSIVKEYFESKGITFENSLKYLKGTKKPFIRRKANKTLTFKKLGLSPLLDNVIAEINYDCYFEKGKISYKDLEPSLIFDYILAEFTDCMEDFMSETYDIEDYTLSDISNRYQEMLDEKITEFAEARGVDLEAKIQEEHLEEYVTDFFNIVFDNGRMYLVPNKPESKIIESIDEPPIKIEYSRNTIEITKIEDEYVSEIVFKKFIKDFNFKKVFRLTMINEKKAKEETATILKEDFFGKNKLVCLDDEEQEETKDEVKETTSNQTSSALLKYGDELTTMPYLKDPAVGRDEELKRIMRILLYPEKDKSIIITGDAGCGKTALVRGLAYRLQKGDVPEALKDLKIYSIDVASLVAGTKYVGTLEEKMKKILAEASKDKNTLIFMDEIHQAISGGVSEGDSNSVAEILKPYLDYGKVRIIGATTNEEYAEHVDSNPAFKTRFKKVSIKEPDKETTYMIINDLIEAYNRISYSKLLVSSEERKTIINWLIDSTKPSYRDYKDKAGNPRMILDIIKEAYAIAAFDNREEVTIEDIAQALLSEDRLYESSRKRQAQTLRTLKPKPVEKTQCKILEFKPKN